MDNQEAVYIGCVMALEATSIENPNQSFTFPALAMSEFCTGHLERGKIPVTARMKMLASAGFKPIALVYRDPEIADRYFPFAHNTVSDAIHEQLAREADAIVKAAAEGAQGSLEAQWLPK